MACGSPLAGGAQADNRLRNLQRSTPEGLQRKMRAAGQALTGERKPVTILFTDIVGSTSIAETMDPEDWREVVAGVHLRVSEAIYRYEGTITQLLGDGVYAFFGAPITHEDDPERSILAALEIQENIGNYRETLADATADLQVRVGINTGEVVIGDIGSDMHVEYLAFGDAVNLAARLETAAEPGTILVSLSTHKQISYQFETKALDPIKVKGKRAPQQVFQVLAERSRSLSDRGVEGLETPLVGRQPAWDTFDLTLKELRGGQGKVIFTVGEAGLGKSRLIADLRNSNLAEGLAWIEGRCQSYEARTPYRLWTSALGVLCGLDPSADATKQKEQLDAYIQGTCSDKRDQTLPYISALFGWDQDIFPVRGNLDLAGSDLQTAIFNAVEILITSTAAHRATVWVCEDLHWADPSSIELLERILRLPARHPLLMICVLRPDTTCAAWELREKLTTTGDVDALEVVLNPLSVAESALLVENILGLKELPENLLARIIARAEGNPFYVEEIIRSLIDAGLIVVDREQGICEIVEGIEAFPFPDSLHAVLLARIDRLPEESRRTLDLASVLGRKFDLDLLSSVLGSMHEGFMVSTDLLVERRFLRPSLDEAGRWFIFNHALTQEAVYNVLLKRDRRTLHALVGETIEAQYPSDLERWYEQLAFHYLRAEDWQKAWTFNRDAGRKAKSQYANHEAIGFLLAAIAVFDQVGNVEIDELIQTTLDLAEIQANINLYEQALESLSECLSLTKRLADDSEKREWQARLHQKEGQVLRSMGDYQRAEKATKTGLEIMLEDSREQRGALKVNLASILTRKGKYAEAREWCLEGIKDLEAAGDQVELAHAYSLLGTIQRDSGDTERSLNYRKQSLALSEAVGSLPLQVEAHNNLAVAYYDSGKYSEAVHHYQQSRDISDRIGNMNTRARAEINLGEIQIIQGDWDLAEVAIQSALDIWKGTGYTLGQAYGACTLGNLYVHRESPEEALVCLERSLALFLDLGAQGFLPAIYRLIAHANYLQGDLDQAEIFCEKAFDLAEELEMNQDLAVILRLQGRLCMEQSDLQTAQEKLGRSVALLNEMNLPYEQARSLCEQARLRKMQGQDGLAKDDLDQAIRTFESLQAKIDLDRAQSLLRE